MKTKTQKSARKSATRKSASKARKPVTGKTTARRARLNPEAKIRLTGTPHSRRKGSRYFRAFEAMRKYKTVAAFLKGYKATTEVPSSCLQAAISDKYISVR